MLEIRFHGRGGQGTVVASVLMANAFFYAKYCVQSFPLFGVERRGAPVEAYLRIDKKDILIRTNVYTPDHLVVMDRTLTDSIDVTKGLKKSGIILINSSEPVESDLFSNFKTAYVDATGIAVKHKLGTRTHPILNTAMLGGLTKVLNLCSMHDVEKAIKKEVPEFVDNNIKAAEEAFSLVKFI